jgi:hypothetical protein
VSWVLSEPGIEFGALGAVELIAVESRGPECRLLIGGGALFLR